MYQIKAKKITFTEKSCHWDDNLHVFIYMKKTDCSHIVDCLGCMIIAGSSWKLCIISVSQKHFDELMLGEEAEFTRPVY